MLNGSVSVSSRRLSKIFLDLCGLVAVPGSHTAPNEIKVLCLHDVSKVMSEVGLPHEHVRQ